MIDRTRLAVALRRFLDDHDKDLVYMVRHEPYPHRCEDSDIPEIADHLTRLYELALYEEEPA